MSKFLDTGSFIFVISLLLVSFNKIELFSQCGCSSSQQFQTPLHWLGTSEQIVTERKKLRLDLIYKFGIGDNLYKGSERISSNLDYTYHFINFFGSYGISHYTSFDLGLNYNIRNLNQYGFTSNGYGFSNLSFGARQTIFESESSDLIINAGVGVHIPLMKFKPIEDYPLVVQPSNGSFGAYAFGMLQKSFPKPSLNVLLFTRFDYYFKNELNYHFAPTNTFSFFISHRLFESLLILFEIRNNVAFQDKYNDTTYTNSGANITFLVPRITYKLGNISISPFVEIPLFQYYKGEQIGNKISFGLNANYLINFSKRNL